ncbi:hypothetical protein CEXT_165151 [Caerostris extrusa]|uniref:Uncharacterized protein n=1 Tax=Caerostris extrusa TaxID=172846 RepID=A0AAV4XTT1_CAEEX|nr:hypothetical protein CEXT_165151 [Caerostris extrusa]
MDATKIEIHDRYFSCYEDHRYHRVFDRKVRLLTSKGRMPFWWAWIRRCCELESGDYPFTNLEIGDIPVTILRRLPVQPLNQENTQLPTFQN